ncbi:unnamed protein product [Prorocentrum cordatum]|uniref:Uncharacterized protein n=1 Tax=Prorocentrum cordatum TaxID=2364126 RepID=A0ABN9XCX7_9DINO|nr:unnamed protein product [Polarella glacialis]
MARRTNQPFPSPPQADARGQPEHLADIGMRVAEVARSLGQQVLKVPPCALPALRELQGKCGAPGAEDMIHGGRALMRHLMLVLEGGERAVSCADNFAECALPAVAGARPPGDPRTLAAAAAEAAAAAALLVGEAEVRQGSLGAALREAEAARRARRDSRGGEPDGEGAAEDWADSARGDDCPEVDFLELDAEFDPDSSMHPEEVTDNPSSECLLVLRDVNKEVA